MNLAQKLDKIEELRDQIEEATDWLKRLEKENPEHVGIQYDHYEDGIWYDHVPLIDPKLLFKILREQVVGRLVPLQSQLNRMLEEE